MILLNFAHPLTDEHRRHIEALTGRHIERTVDIETHIDPQEPLVPQVAVLVDQAGLSSAEWQTLSLLINPPALNVIAVALLAELHGRCGYFPAHLRMRPVPDTTPPRFAVAEVINLQTVREEARNRRIDTRNTDAG